MVRAAQDEQPPQQSHLPQHLGRACSTGENITSFPPAPFSDNDPEDEPRALSRAAWARQPVALTSSTPAPSAHLQVPRPRRPQPPSSANLLIEPPHSGPRAPNPSHNPSPRPRPRPPFHTHHAGINVLHGNDEYSADMSAARTRPWFRTNCYNRAFPTTDTSTSDLALSSVRSESTSTISEAPHVSISLTTQDGHENHFNTTDVHYSTTTVSQIRQRPLLHPRRIVQSQSAFDIHQSDRHVDYDPPLGSTIVLQSSQSHCVLSQRTHDPHYAPHSSFFHPAPVYTEAIRQNAYARSSNDMPKSTLLHRYHSRVRDCSERTSPLTPVIAGSDTFSTSLPSSLPRRRGFRNKPSKNHLTFHVSSRPPQNLNANTSPISFSRNYSVPRNITKVKSSITEDSSPSHSDLSARQNASDDSYYLHMEHRRASIFVAKSRRIRSAFSRIVSRIRN